MTDHTRRSPFLPAAWPLLLLAAACGPVDTSPPAVGSPASAPAPSDHAEAEPVAAREVRAARARFNEAIATRDLETIRALHAPEYHLITGRSAQFHGTEAHVALWEQSFVQDPPDLYVRTTREVRVNEGWGLAEELGDWRGVYTTAEGSRAEASGVYAAKWQRSTHAAGGAGQGGTWLLQSEVFTTMACTGPDIGCRPPDAIGPISGRGELDEP